MAGLVLCNEAISKSDIKSMKNKNIISQEAALTNSAAYKIIIVTGNSNRNESSQFDWCVKNTLLCHIINQSQECYCHHEEQVIRQIPDKTCCCHAGRYAFKQTKHCQEFCLVQKEPQLSPPEIFLTWLINNLEMGFVWNVLLKYLIAANISLMKNVLQQQ